MTPLHPDRIVPRRASGIGQVVADTTDDFWLLAGDVSSFAEVIVEVVQLERFVEKLIGRGSDGLPVLPPHDLLESATSVSLPVKKTVGQIVLPRYPT